MPRSLHFRKLLEPNTELPKGLAWQQARVFWRIDGLPFLSHRFPDHDVYMFFIALCMIYIYIYIAMLPFSVHIQCSYPNERVKHRI